MDAQADAYLCSSMDNSTRISVIPWTVLQGYPCVSADICNRTANKFVKDIDGTMDILEDIRVVEARFVCPSFSPM